MRTRSKSLADLNEWLRTAPPGTSVAAATMLEELEGLSAIEPIEPEGNVGMTWRERLWNVPPETRMSVRDVAEAAGRPVSWVYSRTGQKGKKAPLPHSRLDGKLIFRAGQIRSWLESTEIPGPYLG